MESDRVCALDSPRDTMKMLLRVLVSLGALFFLARAEWVAASSCPPPGPPACRVDGGGGTVPTPTPAPTMPPSTPEPGDPGEGGDDSHPPDIATPEVPQPTVSPPDWGDAYYTHHTCEVLPYCPEYATWTAFCECGSCWLVEYTCLDAAVCVSDDGAGDPGPEPPCVPGYGPGGIYLECDSDAGNGLEWGYDILAWAEVPPHNVQLRPFPRWLVGEPGQLSLARSPDFSTLGGPEGGGLSEGFWSVAVNMPDPVREDPELGDIKDYRIGVRWRMLSPGESEFGGAAAPQSCWFLDEREWNAMPVFCGDSLTYAYETSSFGKLANGPHFVPEAAGCAKVPSEIGTWTNPAYQVRVPTYWVVEWADEWYTWDVVGTEWGDCFYRDSPPLGVTHQGCAAGPHAGESDWYQLGDPIYDWVYTSVGWYPVDLRDYGEATWWYESWAVRTTGAGEWCAYEYADPEPGDTVRVPVIEVQSILVDPCRLDGTCGDLDAP